MSALENAPSQPIVPLIEADLNSDDVKSSNLFGTVARNLADKGYSVHTNGLPYVLSHMLWDEMQGLDFDQFHNAGIGRNHKTQIDTLIRSDEIMWIDATTKSRMAWLKWTASLQDYLNEKLFLGLFSFESHFAQYKNGDFYKTHQDAFQGDDNRKISIIIYLNKNWLLKDGGELILHTNEGSGEDIKVAPEFGTLVVFLSEEMLHEVLETNCDRHSIAGWFRINKAILT